MRELRPVPRPSDLPAVERQNSKPFDAARWPSDSPPPQPRAEAGETRPPEARAGAADDRRQQESLARFEPRRAGLPDVRAGDAGRYIEIRGADRPWLNAARSAPEGVQHVFAALDQGGGHAHIRHEGWVSAEKSQLRVQYLQDPAQLDPVKRANGEDGLLPGGKKHYCAAMSTAIRDPAAFAEAFTKGTEHPDVRRVLDTQPGKGYKPPSVAVPIADLLGPDGHQYCEGYRLVGKDENAARRDRQTWLRETRGGEHPSVPPPMLVPMDFRDGVIQFRFRVNEAKSGHEVATMFPEPPDQAKHR